MFLYLVGPASLLPDPGRACTAIKEIHLNKSFNLVLTPQISCQFNLKLFNSSPTQTLFLDATIFVSQLKWSEWSALICLACSKILTLVSWAIIVESVLNWYNSHLLWAMFCCFLLVCSHVCAMLHFRPYRSQYKTWIYLWIPLYDADYLVLFKEINLSSLRCFYTFCESMAFPNMGQWRELINILIFVVNIFCSGPSSTKKHMKQY